MDRFEQALNKAVRVRGGAGMGIPGAAVIAADKGGLFVCDFQSSLDGMSWLTGGRKNPVLLCSRDGVH
jgi:hypothetical protein